MLFWRDLFLAFLALYINFRLVIDLWIDIFVKPNKLSKYDKDVKIGSILINLVLLVLTIPMDQIAFGCRPINAVVVAIYMLLGLIVYAL